MRKAIEKCPACGDDLTITRMSCTSCETEVSGRFLACRFCKLSPESLQLIEIFIKNRGNVKEMERELGLSYPTVRGRLDAVIKELGFEVDPDPQEDELAERRREVLGQLDRGEIGASEAAELLAKLK